MGLIKDVATAVGGALEPGRSGVERLASRKLGATSTARLEVTSTEFGDGEPLPISATDDGEAVAPPLSWTNVPSTTKSIVILCEDPDAPSANPYVHWLVYGIPSLVTQIDATRAALFPQGKGSSHEIGFVGAAPPRGHGLHRYFFQVFALDCESSSLAEGADRAALLALMKGHVVAFGELVGTYERR